MWAKKLFGWRVFDKKKGATNFSADIFFVALLTKEKRVECWWEGLLDPQAGSAGPLPANHRKTVGANHSAPPQHGMQHRLLILPRLRLCSCLSASIMIHLQENIVHKARQIILCVT